VPLPFTLPPFSGVSQWGVLTGSQPPPRSELLLLMNPPYFGPYPIEISETQVCFSV
jgi:hypothetical protein